jgi:hypothetical protein
VLLPDLERHSVCSPVAAHTTAALDAFRLAIPHICARRPLGNTLPCLDRIATRQQERETPGDHDGVYIFPENGHLALSVRGQMDEVSVQSNGGAPRAGPHRPHPRNLLVKHSDRVVFAVQYPSRTLYTVFDVGPRGCAWFGPLR